MYEHWTYVQNQLNNGAAPLQQIFEQLVEEPYMPMQIFDLFLQRIEKPHAIIADHMVARIWARVLVSRGFRSARSSDPR